MNYGSCPEMHLIANGLELFGYYKFMRSLMSEKMMDVSKKRGKELHFWF